MDCRSDTAAELPSWRVHSQRARGLGDPIRQHSPQQKSRRAAVSIAEQHQRPLAGSPQAGVKLHLTPACRSNPGTRRPAGISLGDRLARIQIGRALLCLQHATAF